MNPETRDAPDQPVAVVSLINTTTIVMTFASTYRRNR